MNRILVPLAGFTAAVMSLTLTPGALAQSDAVIVGYTDLQARLGPDTPTGAGVQVGQIEVPLSVATEYGPNPGDPQFTGKTFSFHSGPVTTSGHANSVGYDYYGNVTSIAQGINRIYVWETVNWLTAGYLMSSSGGAVQPIALPGPIKILNNSWIAAATTAAANNAALRRADFVVSRDSLLICNGMDNDEPGVGDDGTNPALMSHMYNGLAVGVRDGTHTHGVTAGGGLDGPGRHKPEIVAPSDVTSWAVPVVSATGAVLTQTARTAPLASNPLAERTEVLKAVILAGAKKEAAHGAPWTNNPATSGPTRGTTTIPLDLVVGAGTVNVNNSHLILTGGQWAGTAAVPRSTSAGYRGWDVATLGVAESRYYRFNVHDLAAAVSVAATWHRRTTATFGGTFLANVNLTLWRVDPGSTTLQTLVGDGGIPYFAGGDVASLSTIENVEHLYITGLAPGQYVLEVSRIDTLTTQPSWDVAVGWLFPTPSPIVGDINGDGIVNGIDLALLLGQWTGSATYSPCPPFLGADLNQDCKINGLDIGILLGAWG